jgi:hypothetical protein
VQARPRPCVAFLFDLDGDGAAEIMVARPICAYQLSPDGTWRFIGRFEGCTTQAHSLLDAGRFQLVPPKCKELDMQGERLRLQGCPE